MHNILVYKDITHGNQQITEIQKVEGDIWALQKDVEVFLNLLQWKTPVTQINEVTEIPTKGGKDQKPTKNLEETNHELQLDRTLKKQVENYKDGAGLKKERMDHKIFYFP
uniref:Large ribosomal subunit protein mL49 n=1 Tax=Rousettus aegyptiacus TaxID=9407 RepID=A0A7J8GIS2_ROUAE|nr:zinc finger protein 239 [Rousettus aegyptiacus]